MPASSLTYVLSYIRQNIPPQMLELAFKPSQFSSTVEQRVISLIIEGPILQDTNLVGGKRREILISSGWRLDIPNTDQFGNFGIGIEGAFYQVPENAREYRNISSVLGISPFLSSYQGGPGAIVDGSGSYGNTATGLVSQMLNTRTFAQSPVQPMVTLEGTNIIRLYPDLLTDGIAVSVMLENDAEFLNASTSVILALRELCLCAVHRYIANNLRVAVDETQIVAGMEVGVIRTLIDEYSERAKEYPNLLMKVKGAQSFDPRSLSRMIYYGL